MTAFWCITPCSLVELNRRFKSATNRPDNGGSMHLWNVGILQREYKAIYSRKLSSSYSPPWEGEGHKTILSTFKECYHFKFFWQLNNEKINPVSERMGENRTFQHIRESEASWCSTPAHCNSTLAAGVKSLTAMEALLHHFQPDVRKGLTNHAYAHDRY
jgi:hypothetical protein